MKMGLLFAASVMALSATSAEATTYALYTINATIDEVTNPSSPNYTVKTTSNTVSFYTAGFPDTSYSVSFSTTQSGLALTYYNSFGAGASISLTGSGSQPARDGLPYLDTLTSGSYTPLFGHGGPGQNVAYYGRLVSVSTTFFDTPQDLPQLSISSSPVPETATWAMMIVGFGLTGGVMRRRRQKIAVSFA